MAKVRIVQVKSAISRPQDQKDTVKALGLNGPHSSVEVEVTPQVAGMIRKVSHLITVTEF